MGSRETILRTVKLTVRQLKAIILEGMDLLPPRTQVEAALQDAKFDKDAGAKVLSKLDRVLPAGKKLLMQQLSRVLLMWQSDKANWNQVTQILDKIYADPAEQRKSSYASMKAVRPSERPSAWPKSA